MLCQWFHPWFRTKWKVILSQIQRHTYSVGYADKVGNFSLKLQIFWHTSNNAGMQSYMKMEKKNPKLKQNSITSFRKLQWYFLSVLMLQGKCKQELRSCFVCTLFSPQRCFCLIARIFSQQMLFVRMCFVLFLIELLWVNPSGQISTTQSLTHFSPTPSVTGRTGKEK